jgi:DNA repair protein RecO (recombination protein O)
MLVKVRGLVLHHIKYKESSAIIHIYTDLHGRQSYIINNVKGKKGQHRSNLLQPLFFLEMEVYYKPSREMQRIKEFNQYIPYKNIPFDINKSTQAMFIAEVLYKSLKEEESNPELFEFLVHSIQWFDTSEEPQSLFHILFMIQLTKYLGFFPENNYSANSCYFDLRNGQYTGAEQIHPYILNKEVSAELHKLLKKSFSNIGSLKIDHNLRGQLTGSLLDYYRFHIQDFGKLRSIGVLKEIFGQHNDTSWK